MAANSSYVDLGDEDNSISEPPRFPVLWVVVALLVGALVVWVVKRK